MTSDSSAPSPPSIFFATRSRIGMMCTGGRRAGTVSTPKQAVVPVSSIDVFAVCMRDMMTLRSGQCRGSLTPSA